MNAPHLEIYFLVCMYVCICVYLLQHVCYTTVCWSWVSLPTTRVPGTELRSSDMGQGLLSAEPSRHLTRVLGLNSDVGARTVIRRAISSSHAVIL